MKTLIKIRFIPLITGLMVLFLGLFFHFVLQNEAGMKIVKWGIGLSFVGFLFLQAVREKVREKKEKEENPQLQQSHEESYEEMYEEKKKDVIYDIKNRNIPISIVRLFFCILLILIGINLIFSNREYLFGLIILLAGLVATAFSIMWAMKWFKLLKELENKNHIVSFEELDNIVEKEYDVADFGGSKPHLTLRKSGQLYLIMDVPPFYDGDGNEIDGDNDFPEAKEFENLIAEYVSIPVYRVDREVFVIKKPDADTGDKIKEFIENYWKLRKDFCIRFLK
jgi:hypothetical protein